MNAIDFLGESMIVNNCLNVTKPDVSLALYSDRSKFKMYMGDTGLLVSFLLQNGKEPPGWMRMPTPLMSICRTD